MWRKVLGLFWVGVLSACTQPLNRCDEETPCPSGTECQQNVCVGTGETDSAACGGGCADYQVCLANTLQCGPRFLALEVTPADATVLGGGVLNVRAELRLAGNYEARFPESLSLSVEPSGGGAPMALAKTGEGEGVYGAQWTPAEGTYQLTVAHPASGGPSTRVRLTVDKTGPVLTVSLPDRSDGGTPGSGFVYADPGLPGAWRRDQTVALRVESSATDVDPQSLRVRVSGSDGGVSLEDLVVTRSSACDAGIGYCGTVEVPLWKPGMPAFRGEFAVEVNAKDGVGNAGRGTSAIPVTRWKWRYDIAAATITAAPAVGNKGVVYVGTTVSGNTDGRLIAINEDGRVLWDANTGAVVASPSVGVLLPDGSERVYSAPKKGNINRAGYYAGNNTFVGVCTDFSSTSALIQSALAIGRVSIGNATETVYGVYTARGSGQSSGTLFAMRPDAENDVQYQCPVKPAVGDVYAPGSVLAYGPSVVLAPSVNRLKAYNLGDDGTWNSSALWERPLGLANPTAMAVAGGKVFGGSNDGSGSKLFSAPLDGGQDPVTISTSSQVWNISIGGANARGAVGLNSNALLALDTADGGTARIETTSDVIRGAPVWGAGGHVYTASSTTGLIQARRPLETVEWQFDSESPIEASMNLDCGRASDGGVRSGVPGVLYAASQNGKVFAILVDSPGLDPSAPWPKYQHDSRNTGNPETPITSCP